MRYWIFWFVFNVLGRLPVWALYRVADVVAWTGYRLASRSRADVIDNLRHVRPDWPAGKLEAAAKQVFLNVALYYADLASLPRQNAKRLFEERFRIEGIEEHLVPALESKKGVVLLTSHFGNPELVLQGLLALGIQGFALTEPLEPPRLSKLMDEHRSSLGLQFAPVSVSNVKKVMQTLKKGGLVALTGDRDIEGPRARLPFFGVETWMPTGPIELALRTGAIVIPAFCYRRREKFEGYAEEPLALERTGDMEADVRRGELLYLERFERHLREEPGQWAVLERIWDGQKEAGGRK